jgi:hypothetical protein
MARQSPPVNGANSFHSQAGKALKRPHRHLS